MLEKSSLSVSQSLRTIKKLFMWECTWSDLQCKFSFMAVYQPSIKTLFPIVKLTNIHPQVKTLNAVIPI